jgi:molecular chaperone DnaK
MYASNSCTIRRAMSAAVGIDLGTTNTVIAVVVDGIATTLEDEQGRRLIPSIVAFEADGTNLVGEQAKERRVSDPQNTIYSVKRLIGRPCTSAEVQEAKRILPFKLKDGPKESVLVDVRGATYGLPEVSAFVLRRAKQIAEKALGEPVDRAVITVPANFNELQRASTKVAGRLAGLEVLRILNEPTAAALAYGQAIAGASKVAVFDLGGGTFDITVLDLSKDVFEVLSTSGDTSLGGDDFDARIAVHIAELCVKRGYDPRGRPEEFARLKLLAETVKIELSTEREFNRVLNVVDPATGKSHDIELFMTRSMLEKLVSPLVDRTLEVTKRSLMGAGLSARDVDQVILVGGSTRMPVIGASVATLFGKQPTSRINPDEVVALGAAIQGHALNKDRAKRPNVVLAKKGAPPPVRPRAATIVDGLPAPPGILPVVGVGAKPVSAPPSKLGQYTQVQNEATRRVSSAAPPNRTSAPPPMLPPMPRRAPTLSFEIEDPPTLPDLMPVGSSANLKANAAAFASTQMAQDPSSTFRFDFNSLDGGGTAPGAPRVLATTEDGSVATRGKSPLLIDVTPLSLRVETVGGYSDVLLTANTPVPCERTRVFMTAHDNQTTVSVRVAQGERTEFAGNMPLGHVELTGIRPASRGEVKILVTFELDADGTLNVRAKEDGTTREATATMKLTGAQTDAAEMEAMMARQQARPVTG